MEATQTHKRLVSEDGFVIPHGLRQLRGWPYARSKDHAQLAIVLQSPSEHPLKGVLPSDSVVRSFSRQIENAASAGKCVLLSSEEFSKRVKFTALSQLLAPFAPAIRAVVVHRRFYAWLMSYHNEQSKAEFLNASRTLADTARSYVPLVDFLRSGGIDATWEYSVLPLAARLRASFGAGSVEVLNMHGAASILEQLACGGLPAPHVCANVRREQMENEPHMNTGVSLVGLDVLAAATSRQHVSPTEAANTIVASAHASTLQLMETLGGEEPPMRCAPNSTRDRLLNLTAQTEAALLPRWHDRAALERDMDADLARRGGLCSFDADASAAKRWLKLAARSITPT